MTRAPSLIAPIAVGMALAALLWPELAHAVSLWSTTEEFSYGFLILPVAALLVWWRRGDLRRNIGPGARSGLAIVIAALAVYILAWRMGIHALAGLAVSPLLFGMVVYLAGWPAGRVLAFPIGFLAFGLGLFRGLLDTVGFALQGVTAFGATALARAVGVPVIRDGLVLSSDKFTFVVAEGCSGMSSLVSLLALATLWTYVARGALSGRLAVLLSSVPLVVMANSLRVGIVLIVANAFGQDAAMGYFHGLSSLVLFGVAVAGLFVVSRVARCKPFGFAV